MNKRLIKLKSSLGDQNRQFVEKINRCFLVALPYRIRVEITDFYFVEIK